MLTFAPETLPDFTILCVEDSIGCDLVVLCAIHDSVEHKQRLIDKEHPRGVVQHSSKVGGASPLVTQKMEEDGLAWGDRHHGLRGGHVEVGLQWWLEANHIIKVWQL